MENEGDEIGATEASTVGGKRQGRAISAELKIMLKSLLFLAYVPRTPRAAELGVGRGGHEGVRGSIAI